MHKTDGKICNVLFTSAGRRVELLRAFRAAFERLNLRGNIIALDIDPLAPALQAADVKRLMPRHSAPEYVPSLVEICRREQVNLIIPLIDPDIPLLAANRHEIEAIGARLAVVPAEAAQTISDKWETYNFFSRLGVKTPRSWLPEHLDFAALQYPLFIKPRGGSAAQNTFKVESEAHLRFFLDYVPQPIIQEYLPGAEITNDVVCGLDGEVLSVVSRRRIEVRWGEVAKGVTICDAGIVESCAEIARALPAVGPITVQCMLRGDEPYFTEINARFGGGAPLGFAAGADSIGLLLARVAGIEMDAPPLVGSSRAGIYMTRYDESFFLTENEYEQMAGNRL